MSEDLGGVIPISQANGNRGRRERKKWRFVQWGWTTLSKTATVGLTVFSVLYFWRLWMPYVGYWQDGSSGVIAVLVVALLYFVMRRPEGASQTPGSEWEVIKKISFALVPAFMMPVVVYRYFVIPDATAPPHSVGFAFLYFALVLYTFVDQTYTGLRYSERTTSVGPTPPG